MLISIVNRCKNIKFRNLSGNYVKTDEDPATMIFRHAHRIAKAVKTAPRANSYKTKLPCKKTFILMAALKMLEIYIHYSLRFFPCPKNKIFYRVHAGFEHDIFV